MEAGAVPGAWWFADQTSACAPANVKRILEDGGVVPVRLEDTGYCACECPIPSRAILSWKLAQPGRTVWTWDARSDVIYSVPRSCGSYTVTVRVGVAQPAPPGRYVAYFIVTDTMPAGCSQPSATIATCPDERVWRAAPTAALCPYSRAVAVQFDLPETGDVTVIVPLGV